MSAIGGDLDIRYGPFRFDGRVTSAWNLIGAEGEFRIRGGRALYDDVYLGDGSRTDRVLLRRLDPVDDGRVRQINRWVNPDEEIEVFAIDGDAAERLGWIGRLRWDDDGNCYREEVGS